MGSICTPPAGCKGCIYLNTSSGVCDYNHVTGKLRSTQKAPTLPGGGCRLKKEGAKPIMNLTSTGEPLYRVTLPNGKVRLLKKEQLEAYEKGEYPWF